MITWLKLYLGYTGGTRRIYCICRERHLTVRPKRRPNGITKADRQAEKWKNLIKRNFTAEKPNQKYLTDIPQIPRADESSTWRQCWTVSTAALMGLPW